MHDPFRRNMAAGVACEDEALEFPDTSGCPLASSQVRLSELLWPGHIESFNPTCRGELLDRHLLATLDDVRQAACWGMLEYQQGAPPTSHRANARRGGSPGAGAGSIGKSP